MGETRGGGGQEGAEADWGTMYSFALRVGGGAGRARGIAALRGLGRRRRRVCGGACGLVTPRSWQRGARVLLMRRAASGLAARREAVPGLFRTISSRCM